MIRMDKENQAIMSLKDQHIAFQDTIITKYSKLDTNNQKLDTNSQRIDTLGQDSNQILKDQHREDKQAIADLTKDLNSCKSSQKYVFGAGAIAGGLVGYKIRGAGTFQSPFASSQANAGRSSFTLAPQSDFLNWQWQNYQAEDRLKRALKTISH